MRMYSAYRLQGEAKYVDGFTRLTIRPVIDPVHAAIEHYVEAVNTFRACSAANPSTLHMVTEDMARAQEKLMRTKPTTPDGVVALLEHVEDYPDHHDTHEVHALLISALDRMTRR